MSTSSDDQPTRVLPQAAPEQPSATAAPATRRSSTWHRSVPSHIGRARTSTLVLGGLFLVLFVLNLFLPSQVSGTTMLTTPDGRTVEVPNSALPSDARNTPTPTPTTAPATPTSQVPQDDGEDEEPVSTPSRTTTRAPAPSPTPTQAPSATTGTTEEETTQSAPTGTTTPGTTTGTTTAGTTSDTTD